MASLGALLKLRRPYIASVVSEPKLCELKFSRQTGKLRCQRLEYWEGRGAQYLEFWTWGVLPKTSGLGGVGMLAFLCGPLAWAHVLLPHVPCLGWNGRTNETSKWADWRDDIEDGNVFKSQTEHECGQWKTLEIRNVEPFRGLADLQYTNSL